MKTLLKIIILVGITTGFHSCTLQQQDEFDFVPENNFADPFGNTTAWDYIQTRTTNAIIDDENRKELNGEELDFMIAAIKHVGYQDLYSQTATNRTYLLLNNNAFTGNNRDRDLIRAVTGRTQGTRSRVNADTLMASITEPGQINKLKAFLKHHIIEEEVAQVPKITIFDKDFIFKTLLPQVNIDPNTGEATGLSDLKAEIALRRNIEWKMEVNNANAPLISTAVERGFNEKVRVHNYVFSNGVGHYLNDTVRYQPFPLYENFSVD